MQPWCKEIINIFGPTIIAMLENKETPDKVCQQLKFCTNDQCHLWPKPTFANAEEREAHEARAKKYENADLGERVTERAYLDLPVVNHRPLLDLDGDGHSTMFELRGYAWRGKDCNDWDSGIHPGRVPVQSGDSYTVDYNCNGITGTNPATGNSYEQDLCANTKPVGIAILGDSAAAHFAIPPAWVTPSQVSGHAFKDILKILENELDWPDMSSTTGYHVSDFVGSPGPQVSSFYLKNIQRNKCSMRDFQNIGVNGARSGSMAASIVQTMSRNYKTDNPMLINLALIGNDVCNGHHDFTSMTTPQQMYDNTMKTLRYLDDSRVPAGSHLLMTGLADGRVLFEGLADRIHPIGSARNDVTYSAFYDFLNCLETSPCWGWMNTNATVRNTTAVRQRELNAVLARIARTESFKNFDVIYIDDPFTAIINQWVSGGGKLYQLIEAVDGFHPSQIANSLMADYIWKFLEDNHPSFIPALNPNNDKITTIFGDQGGLN